MSMTLTRREARLALIQALERKYPEKGVLSHQAIEIGVVEAEHPEEVAIEAREVAARSCAK
jgi:hypothetical protein